MGAQMRRWLQFDMRATLEYGIEVQSKKNLIHIYYQPYGILFMIILND